MPDSKNKVTLLKVIRTIFCDSITIMLIFVVEINLFYFESTFFIFIHSAFCICFQLQNGSVFNPTQGG